MQHHVTAAILTCTIASGASGNLVQWRVEDGGNGHWYGLTSVHGSWDEMEADALLAGGHLASVTSAAENAFILSLIPNTLGGPGNACWIGLSRPGNGSWAWSDGSAFGYTFWNGGEPNNATGQEFWVWMYGPHGKPNSDGRWNDHNQWDYDLPGVIEVVPAPSALALFALAGGARRRRR